jgi:DHA1 family tetracycline resistance protein-like MFS transporter
VLSVITQGFLVGRITKKFREDILIVGSVALMGISLLGWALAPSLIILLIVLAPTSLSGGILNTLLSSTLTKSVAPQEIGGILGLSASVESSTRILAPILGGALLQQLGTWAPGMFGFVVMAGLLVYVWMKIYNHPLIIAFEQKQLAPAPVTIQD